MAAAAVANAAAIAYKTVTGREPHRVTHPDTDVPGGKFLPFLRDIFDAAGVDGKALVHNIRLTTGRQIR